MVGYQEEKIMDQHLWQHILEVSRRLAETRELGPLLNEVMDRAIALVGAERGYIVFVKSDGSLDFSVKRGKIEEESEKSKDQVSRSVLYQVVETSRPLLLLDAQHDPHFSDAEHVVILGLRSIMCVPLISRGKVIGAIYVENRSVKGRFKEEDISLLEIFANQVAVAIENARLIQALQESRDKLEERVEARTAELRIAVEQLEQEISERVRAEAAVRQERDKAQRYLDITPSIIIALDPDGNITMLNREGSDILECDQDEVIGQNWFDTFLPDEIRAWVKEAFTKVMTGDGEPMDYVEGMVVTGKGNEKYIRWRNSLMRDAAGNITGALTSGEDITGYKRAETALRESENMLTSLLQMLPVGVCLTDEEGRYTLVNDTYCDIYEFNRDEILGQSFTTIMPPDQVEIAKAHYAQLLGGDMGIPVERKRQRKDGSIIYIEAANALLIHEGGQRSVITTVRDITERNQADQALLQRNREFALINQASQAFNSTLELGQVLQTILEEMHQLLNITATSFWLVLPDTKELVCRRVTGPGSETLLGWRLMPGQGLTGQVAASGKPLIVADTSVEAQHFGVIDERIGVNLRSLLSIPLQVKGEVIGVLNLNDSQVGRFTEGDLFLLESIAAAAASAVKNARLFNEAEQARKAAEEANKAKSVFLATMSHELRTPLNGILGYAQILKRDFEITEHQIYGLDTIEQSGRHLLMLINDILDISKIEAGKMELYFTDFHLPTFLNNIAAIIGIRAEQKGISFVYVPFDFVADIPLAFSTGQRTLPVAVRADQQRLRQVLVNLLGNAVKFTNAGAVAFKVGPVQNKSVALVATDGQTRPEVFRQRVRFQVEDTGIGIEPEQLVRIFQPFEQAGDHRLQTEGTGLGLAISHHMVQMMGSKLEVKSKPDEGSTFWFELDMLEVPNWTAVNKTTEKVVGYQGRRQKILVIDDNRQNYEMLANLLSTLGFEIIQARDGEKGLITAQKTSPDAILIDLKSSRADGLEVTREIRRISQLQNIVTIVMSADVLESRKQEALAAGCDGFIAKPIHIESLLDTLQSLLGLQWIYDDEAGLKKQPGKVDAAARLVPPPAEDLSILLDLARMGDVAAIREQADRLDELDDNYIYFTTELRRLVQHFQINKLCRFIEQFLEEN